AAVLDGRAGDERLATDAHEREPVGRRVVDEARAAWRAISEPEAAPFAGRTLRQIDMGYRYDSAAVCPDGTPDRDRRDGPLDAPLDYLPTADPGCRAPHLWLGGGR